MRKMKLNSKLLALFVFFASISGLNAQTWEFTSDIENWNWQQSSCAISQSSGSLVISSDGSGNATFGVYDQNIPATDLNYLVLNLKNQSNAPYFVMYVVVLIPDGNGGYTESWKYLDFSVTSNSESYEPYIINLSSKISDFSHTWKIKGIRIDAVSQTATSVISIDYVRIVKTIPVETITVQGPSTITKLGKTAQFSATVLPAHALDKTIVYSVSDENVATINPSTGILTTVSAGKVTVTATAQDGSGVFGTFEVNITDGLAIAKQWEFTSDIENWNWQQSSCAISQSSGSLVISSDGSGNATFGVYDQNVPATDVNYLVLNLKNQSNAPYFVMYVVVLIPDGSGGYTESWKYLDFSVTSNSESYETYLINLSSKISDFSHTWIIKGFRIDAVSQTSTSVISIDYVRLIDKLPLVDLITVSGPTEIAGLGVQAQMSATIEPVIALNTVTWSVDNTDKATIDKNSGLLTSVAIGDVIVTATATDGSGVSGSKTVTIIQVPVTGIAIDAPASTEVNLVNDYKILTFTITPADASIKTATWSVTNKTGSATIDNTGKLLPVSEGIVTVIVTSNDNPSVSDSLDITIKSIAIPVTSINLSASRTEINFDETLQFSYTFEPFNASDTNVIWSVVPGTGTATISNTGLLTAQTPGSVTVKATAADGSGVIGEKAITITNIITEATSITIKGVSAVYGLGKTIQMSVLYNPANTTWKNAKFSVNDASIATIDENTGMLTSVAVGEVTITAKIESTGVQATKVVRILNGQVITKEWTFDTDMETWGWGLDKCAISQSNGNLVINSAGGGNASFGVNNVDFPATDVNYLTLYLKNESPAPYYAIHLWVLIPDENGTYSETIRSMFPSFTANSTEFEPYVVNLAKEISDYSNDWRINRMRIDAVAQTATSVISIDKVSFISSIIPVNSITVNGPDKLTKGSTAKMTADVLPLDATNNTYKFSVSDETIATIDSKTGMLTGVSDGDVTVIVTALDGSGIIGEKVVTINNEIVQASAITVTGASVLDGLGLEEQYSVSISPENTTNKTVKFSVNDQNIATIDENTGILTTVAVGEVTITATSQDGSGVKGEKVVTVIHTVYATSISIVGPSIIDGLGKQVQLSVAFQPESTTNKAIKYTVDKPHVATVDENGLLTTVGTGVVRVVAETLGGSLLTARIVITVTNLTSLDAYDAESLKIFPNPATNNLTISSGTHQVNEVKIVDLQGRVVYANKEHFIGPKAFNISLNKGIYFVYLTGDIPFAAQKLIIE